MKTDQFLKEELQSINRILAKHLIDKNTSSLFFKFDKINLLNILIHVSCEKIFYFKSKYDDFIFLGLGHSKTIKASDLNQYTHDNPEQLLIASFLFEENPNASEFTLPEWAFISRKGETELSIYPSFIFKTFSLLNSFFDLNSYRDDSSIPQWQSYEEHPEHDQWSEMINKCNNLFKNNELDKIVLSRRKIFSYENTIIPLTFFISLLKKNDNANSCYAIFNQTSYHTAFISMTPEKLFSIHGNHFQSISLAASAPRGKTTEEDLSFEKLLTTNEKLTREHNFVTEEILKKIKPFAKTVNTSELQTVKLPYIQHRSIPIHAQLLAEISSINLIQVLHPTPAVGGIPWEKAKIKILEFEPSPRNYYAAPIGIISAQYSELAVGIRSALIEEKRITLYGGAGIVKGSEAEEEWIETGMKMNPFLKVINHE